MSMNVYKIVTDRIIAKLKQGVVPWRKPWVNGQPPVAINWMTQKPYRGINQWLLEPGEYATILQINEAGGRVKKGEKASIVVFWKWIEKEDEETGEVEKIPFLRYYSVFEINTQVEGLQSKRKPVQQFDHDPIEAGEKIVREYVNKPEIRYAPGQAYYHKGLDYISVPPLKDFPNPNEFYSVLFHEMIHSTGHPDRLNRKGIATPAAFGDQDYSKEELVAELGAAMLCSLAGIEDTTIDNSAAYIQSWINQLENDSRLIIHAAAQAQKALNYITGNQYQAE
jgi:antirestriction protein ArdC